MTNGHHHSTTGHTHTHTHTLTQTHTNLKRRATMDRITTTRARPRHCTTRPGQMDWYLIRGLNSNPRHKNRRLARATFHWRFFNRHKSCWTKLEGKTWHRDQSTQKGQRKLAIFICFFGTSTCRAKKQKHDHAKLSRRQKESADWQQLVRSKSNTSTKFLGSQLETVEKLFCFCWKKRKTNETQKNVANPKSLVSRREFSNFPGTGWSNKQNN